MRVLHIGAKNYPPSHGGTERVVYDLVTGSIDVESHILVEFEQEESENIKRLPKGYFRKLQYIINYVKTNRIEIIHFHNETYVPLALIFSIFNKNNLLTIHGCHFTNPKYSWFQRISILIFDILGAAFLPNLVFCSEVDKKKFDKIISFRKLYFVPNGVHIPNNHIDNRHKNKNILVYLGRISPEKNLLKLIEAAEFSNTQVHIYGAFDERRPEFNEKIKNALRNSNYVNWKGVVPYSEVLSVLSTYSTFIYPSVSEGLPLSVLEAAACNLKLILSEIPQHKILNFPDVEYINTKSFCIDKGWFEFNEIKNKTHVEENFSVDIMLKGYNDIYKKISNIKINYE